MLMTDKTATQAAGLCQSLHLFASAVVILFVLTLPVPAQTKVDETDLLNFFAGQGCAIGPSTREAAIVTGFKPEAIDEFAETMRADDATI